MPRSTFIGADWSNVEATAREVQADLVQKLGGGWELRAVARRRTQSSHNAYASLLAYGAITSLDDSVDFLLNRSRTSAGAWGADVSVSGSFEALGQSQQLLIGANYDRRVTTTYSAFGFDTAPLFDSTSLPEPDLADGGGSRSRTVQYGLYGQARLKPVSPLTIILGGRVTSFRAASQDVYPLAGDYVPGARATARFTPFAGALLDLTRTITAYASYSDIFVPQTERTVAGTVLPPRTGAQFEGGLKGAFLDGALNASLAVFRLRDRNRAYVDPDFPNGDFYLAAGKVESKGVEAEVSGKVTPQWDVFAGYTWLKTRYLKDTYSPGATFEPYEPRNSLKLWTRYRFDRGALDGFSLGGGVIYSSALKSATVPQIRQGPFAVVNGQIGYRITPRIEVTAALNNIFDRKYYQRVSYLGQSNYFGEPRNVLFSIRARY